ncbi:AMP-binding protein [Mycolicibacterium holsaticum]|uniref:Acyl-CoA synthetase n=1 Tax=Mycolicibacterium holsaticum TaxID=152142 RepID=A0A1E3R4Y0_9MYCO|nr:AMP-binding protein [Mycolicibacterium holsaticum]ODQ84791.1 hypothetical protein BHQ17_25835 [Mycolicibacterium holsaticum]
MTAPTPDALCGTYAELIATFAHRPDSAVAIRDDQSTLTYHQLYGRVGAVAAWLSDIGVAAGDTVAIMISNSAELLVVQLAVQAVGAVGALVNTNLEGQALQHIIELSQPITTLADPASAARLCEQSLKCHSTNDTDMQAGLSGHRDPAPWLDQRSGTGADPAFISFTSGTTGVPKGVVLDQTTSVRALLVGAALGLRDGAETFYIPTPAYHAMGLAWASLGLRLGATLVLRRRFSASKFWPDIREHKCTFAYYLGTMPQMIYNQPAHPDDGAHDLKAFLGGGMPAEIWVEFGKRFNVQIIESYSGSDTVGAFSNFGNAPVGSLGKPSPDIEVRLVAADGTDVPAGQPGELIVRPKQPTDQPAIVYFRDEEATRKKNEGGWVHTGDVLRADADGNYYFVDRLRHMIRRRGVNIASAEIENILCGHRAIAQCAAVGVPAALGEEEVKLVVRPSHGAVTEVDVAQIASELLPEYMRPRYIELVSELPLTVTQRIIQFELKRNWDTESTWDVELGRYPFQSISG